MTLPPIDFSPLAPPDGDAHWERLASRIEAAAAAELGRRAAAGTGTWRVIVLRRQRALFAAAAAVALLAAAAILSQPSTRMDPAAVALASVLGVSYEAAGTLTRESPPGLAELILLATDR